jgi:hypothetical protein
MKRIPPRTARAPRRIDQDYKALIRRHYFRSRHRAQVVKEWKEQAIIAQDYELASHLRLVQRRLEEIAIARPTWMKQLSGRA